MLMPRWPGRVAALALLRLCSVALAVTGWNGTEQELQWYGDEDTAVARRTSVPDDETGALYSASAYAFIYGTPEAAAVPIVVGFRTAALAAYGTSQRSKLKLTAASGVDLSSFSIQDVQDVVNLPAITWVEANPTQVQLFFEQEPLRADTEYELTIRGLTAAAGASLGNIAVAWYSYNQASRQWVKLEESTARQEGGSLLRQGSATIKTAANSFQGSGVAAAWATGSATSVLVELQMQAPVTGIVSIVPFPPSAWDLGSLSGAGVVDGAPCPEGGGQSQALDVQVPSAAAHCFLRKRGRHVNSVDVWFLAADLSKGVSVTLSLPRPLVGTLGSWYLAYRELGSSPGSLVSELPVAFTALQVLGPRPHVSVAGCTSTYPGRPSTLSISFRLGANLVSLVNSSVEFRLDPTVFRIEQDGCEFRTGDAKPLGAVVQASTVANTCNMSWSPSQANLGLWSHVYTLSITGLNVPTNATRLVGAQIVLFSGQDADGNGEPDSWLARYEGDGCRIGLPPAFPAVSIHPTTVAVNTKARMLLSFQTGSSSRYSGEADEHLARGMVLRLSAVHPTAIRLHKADGTDFQTSATEAMQVDCSAWALELWGEGGFPHPSHCWWDAWSSEQPSVYMRFRPKGGLRMRQTYEMVFLATLALAADGPSDLVTLELEDGDGSAYLNEGSAGITRTLVTQPLRGVADEPTVTALELVGGDPLTGNEVAFRASGGYENGNFITANNLMRLFLFPLTAWHVTSCTARRSDGSLVTCAVERVGRNANTLLLTLDQNSLPIANGTDVLFTVSNVQAPAGGFFRGEFGCELWHHPRETARFMASYVTSAEGRLGSNNFASAPVAGGSSFIAAHQKSFAEEVNGMVHIVYRPAATCISYAAMPCQLSLTVPDGFLALSLVQPNGTTLHASLAGTEAVPLSPSSLCEQQRRACTLVALEGSTLWAGASYSFTLLVSNPVSPLGKDVPWNAWTIELSGADRWGLARRQVGQPATLAQPFAVLGRLASAAVQPSGLVCGSRVHVRLQFATLQGVPSAGKVLITAPAGFAWQESSAGSCYTFEHSEWPGAASCTVLGTTATLVPIAPLGARILYAFSMSGQLPSVPMAAGRSFSITTESATTQLDSAPVVSWSAQRHASGELVFPELFDCYPHALHTFRVSVDDMRPYLATWTMATVTVQFELGETEVLETPIGVHVYAPAGYQWQAAGFNPSPGISGVVAAPLLVSPDWLSSSRESDANLLSLLTTSQLDRQVLYGFTAQARVPPATPGSAANPASGNEWYIALGTGAFGEEKRAAGRAFVQQPEVRTISGLALRRSTVAALSTGALSVAFGIVTALPSGGLLRLELPAGFGFGSHLGQQCSADALWSQGLSASALPADAAMTCRAAAGGAPAAFEWRAGASGIAQGRYEVSVFVRNPPAADDGRADARGSFVLRSFLDGAGSVVADAPASRPVIAEGGELQQAELVVAHVDSRTGIFDPHPGASTWVVFAFELAHDVEPEFAIDVRAPEGFGFASNCEVHIGDGSTYSPLGDSLTVLPPHVTRYVLFPSGTSATCLGYGREARIKISPTVPGSRSSFLAVPGRLHLFRVRVTNPSSTPAVNKWLLRAAGQEYGDIAGYDLLEFRGFSARPSYAAAGADDQVTVSFWSRSAIPGRVAASAADHGLLSVRMPEGFILRTSGTNCLGYAGLRNATGGQLPAEVTCEAWPGDQRRLALHNRMLMADLPPGQYEFSVTVRNPTFPAEALNWQLASYQQQAATSSGLLDFTEAPGFVVSYPFRSFSVEPEPSGQQNAGAQATLRFRLIPAREVLPGDVLTVFGPEEYSFECTTGFASELLPPPSCSGNRVVFSFLQANSSVLPKLVPFGLEGATVLTFQLGIRNPTVKPARNVMEFSHCRGASTNFTSVSSGCPAGSRMVATVQHPLWQIVPRIQGVQVSLLEPKVVAQGKSSHFLLNFTGASAGAVRVRVESPGTNFTGCLALFRGVEIFSQGHVGYADVTLPGGLEIPAGQPFELMLRRVKNRAQPGPTTWGVTTYDAAGAIVDQALGHVGYTILRLLELDALVACQPQFLLSPEVSEAQKGSCTARFPWYEHVGNLVTLRFRGLSGGEIMNGHQLLIQPPAGYSFPASSSGSPLVLPLSGLSGSDGDGVASTRLQASSLSLTDARFASEVVSVRFVSGLAMLSPFSVQVRVNNPVLDPADNFWRFMLLAPDGTPLYTNDGTWPGFALYGTFYTTGQLSAVRWLVSDFPSEPNVVRLQVSLASPLTGQALKLQVTAPQGFAFDTYCLPTEPDLLPQPGLTNGFTVSVPWVTGCAAPGSSRNIATLALANNLEKRTLYAVNLLLTNAAIFQATAFWELRTFRDNDELNFVHYTALPPFALRVMEAVVLPESRKYEASSLLHVSLRSQRDLGPHGEIVVTAPEGYRLFCRLRPYFSRGNLPSGVGCDGANNYAVVQLSGGDSLERGVQYQFAVRVTNPSATAFGQLSGQSSGGVPTWSVRLQTRERELVHETTQVAGYAPASKAVARFAIAASTSAPGAVAWVQAQFKLETPLVRGRDNRLELAAPTGFIFTCAEELARNSYVLPANAVYSANLPRFQDLLPFLELPPVRGSTDYRNEGTTEDGHAIVDCSRASFMSLAVDSTDSLSFGRYAFQVSVRNPQALPVPNVWLLRSYEEGGLLEEGATAGYALGGAASTDLPAQQTQQQSGTVAQSASERASTATLPLLVLIGISLALAS